jgi:hypothetical protein
LGESASCTYTSSLAESDEQSLGDTLDHIQITDRLRSGVYFKKVPAILGTNNIFFFNPEKTKVLNNDGSVPMNIDVLQNIMTGENSIQSFGNIKVCWNAFQKLSFL